MISRILVVLCAAAPILAQHAPQSDQGRELFIKNCSACHGDTGQGGRGPDLTTGVWKHGSTDQELARNINKGIPGTQMPPVPLLEEETRAVVAYLRSLSGDSGLTAT